MTKQEAIEILKEIIDEGWLISDFDKCTAIDACEMAIKAIEQEPCEDCVSRKNDNNKKLLEIKQIIKDHDEDSIPEDFFYIDKIREVINK